MILCRLLGHRFEVVLSTGSWTYAQCSRCKVRQVLRGPEVLRHAPDLEWIDGEDKLPDIEATQ